MAKTDKTTGDGVLEATDALAPPQEAIALDAAGAAGAVGSESASRTAGTQGQETAQAPTGRATATPGDPRPLAAWATERGAPAWLVAGLLRHQGWTEDRAVSAAEYDQAVTAFERRPLGA